MERMFDPSDLTDATGVAEILGLANRSSVSVYQRRYPEMPRPAVDLGRGRTKLWSKVDIASWASAADRRSPQAITKAELAQLRLSDSGLSVGIFKATFTSVRQHALGGGRKPREVGGLRRNAYDIALRQARESDPAFDVETPPDWLDG